MIFFGAFRLPLGAPKPTPLTVIVGKPIKIPKNENPTDEDIDEYHSKFVTAVEKLYNDYKADYGMGDIPLVLK